MCALAVASEQATRIRVLVVDDDRVFLELVGRMVRRVRPDAKVHLHSDAETALAFYEACWESIDVVLLDLMIGQTDGVDLAQRLRAINPLEQVILMSAFSTDAWVSHKGRDHVAFFLQKAQIGNSQNALGSALGYYLDRAFEAKRAEIDRKRLLDRVRELDDRRLMSGYIVRDLAERVAGVQREAGALAAGREQGPRALLAELKRVDQALGDLADMVGRPEPCGEETCLVDVVQAALQRCHELLRRRHVDLDVRPLLLSVQAPSSLVVQVLAQLVSVAIHLVAPGRVPKLCFHCSERGDQVRLWLDHNGIGVTEEEASRVFRLFGRLHAVQALDGEAAGLAIAQRTMARLGGTLGMQEHQHEGGRFWLELPRAGS